MTNAETAQTLKIISTSLWGIARGLERIERMLRNIVKQENSEMTTLADIKAKVEAEHTVELSVVALLQQLKQMLADAMASNDPAALQEIANMLDMQTQSLSEAVVSNTPAG